MDATDIARSLGLNTENVGSAIAKMGPVAGSIGGPPAQGALNAIGNFVKSNFGTTPLSPADELGMLSGVLPGISMLSSIFSNPTMVNNLSAPALQTPRPDISDPAIQAAMEMAPGYIGLETAPSVAAPMGVDPTSEASMASAAQAASINAGLDARAQQAAGAPAGSGGVAGAGATAGVGTGVGVGAAADGTSDASGAGAAGPGAGAAGAGEGPDGGGEGGGYSKGGVITPGKMAPTSVPGEDGEISAKKGEGVLNLDAMKDIKADGLKLLNEHDDTRKLIAALLNHQKKQKLDRFKSSETASLKSAQQAALQGSEPLSARKPASSPRKIAA